MEVLPRHSCTIGLRARWLILLAGTNLAVLDESLPGLITSDFSLFVPRFVSGGVFWWLKTVAFLRDPTFVVW